MGYGARALESLNSFYSGDLLNLDEVMEEDSAETFAEAASKVDKVRSNSRLSTRPSSPSLTPYVRTGHHLAN
jgi:N-acetyltransferase 10